MSEVLPRGWTRAYLADIADVQLGKMLSAKSRTGHGARPYIRNVNVRWGTIDVTDVLDMDFDAREVEKYQLMQGDLLVCEGGEPGRTAAWRDQLPGALYQKALHRVRFPHGEFEPSLFAYFIEWAAKSGRLRPHLTGSTIKHLPRESFLTLSVAVPPAAEQRRIVAAIEEHLSRLDAAVAGLKKAHSLIPLYRAAVLRDAYDGSLAQVLGRQFNPEVQVLGDLLERIEAGRSFKCEERPPREGEFGVVKVSAVTWGEFDESQSKTVRDSARIEPRFLIHHGDLLFSRANTVALVGACVIVKSQPRALMLSDKILRLVPKPGVSPRWLLVCLRSRQGREAIKRLATGNQESMRNIGQDRIRQIPVPTVPADVSEVLLQEVERRLSLVDAVEAEVDAALTRAARLRQSILKRAFAGELVPQDPSDEPARALLERICTMRLSAAATRKKTRRPA